MESETENDAKASREPEVRQSFKVRTASGSCLAFTLTELLVVLAVIAILAALLLGALGGAEERARRAACQNQLHQFYIALHLYSADFREKLPSGPGVPDDEHIPIMSHDLRDAFVRYTGSIHILDCPSLRKPFGTNWQFTDYGYVLGYNYLGGKQKTPWFPSPDITNSWISPQSMSENPRLVVLADLNDWSVSYGKTFVPHSRHGSILRGTNFFTPFTKGVTPPEVGATGGNICTLDGAVEWKPIRRMSFYHGSEKWGQDGCYAMW